MIFEDTKSKESGLHDRYGPYIFGVVTYRKMINLFC